MANKLYIIKIPFITVNGHNCRAIFEKKNKPSGSKAGTLLVHDFLGNLEASVQVWRYLAVKTLETSCD